MTNGHVPGPCSLATFPGFVAADRRGRSRSWRTSSLHNDEEPPLCDQGHVLNPDRQPPHRLSDASRSASAALGNTAFCTPVDLSSGQGNSRSPSDSSPVGAYDPSGDWPTLSRNSNVSRAPNPRHLWFPSRRVCGRAQHQSTNRAPYASFTTSRWVQEVTSSTPWIARIRSSVRHS